MTPELSRRIARALHHLPPGVLAPVFWPRVAREAQPANDVAELPDWIQQVVERGEAAAGPPAAAPTAPASDPAAAPAAAPAAPAGTDGAK